MSPYQRFINNLCHADLQRLIQGQAGIGCNDITYLLVSDGVMPEQPTNTEAVREYLLAQEQSILEQLYQNRPLCREEFDHQAEQLLQEYGPERFYRSEDTSWALMIDGSLLSAVPPEDVRSRYGYYCEGDEALSCEQARTAVHRWLKDGIAYEDYQVKTHCRYVCR